MPAHTTYTRIAPDDLARAFDAELTRLLTRGLSAEEETLARRYYSQKERDSMDASDFCGPHQSFPVKTQEDVDNAAGLAGHAENPDAVRACIRKKAKAHGWKLPESWTEGEQDDGDRVQSPALLRADGTHDPMTGTHTHPHPAFGSQGDDDTHSHAHSHDGDADHHHAHTDAEEAEQRAAMPTTALLSAPIIRIDPKKWEVEGVATSEEIDTFGTIFGYEGSKRAFAEWADRAANVREMHEKKAVGKGIWFYPDDAAKKIHVGTRVSRGAPDTWAKVEDGVLNGLSVGATDVVWGTIERNGKTYPYVKSYRLAELSLVDNASNPDAQGLVICRADGNTTDLVEVSEQQETPAPASSSSSSSSFPVPSTPVVERAGARLSGETRAAMHAGLAHTLHAAAAQMRTCNCEGCQSALKQLDPDGDGDIDLGGYDDPDQDGASLYAQDVQADMDRAIEAALERLLPGAISRVMAPIYSRQQSFLARLAQVPETPGDLPLITGAITTLASRLDDLATTASLDEVRAAQAAVKDQVARIAEIVTRIDAQPAPGGPVLSGGGSPVEKRLAGDPRQFAGERPPDAAATRAVLDRLQAAGALNSIEAQTAAAALLIQPMPGRRG